MSASNQDNAQLSQGRILGGRFQLEAKICNCAASSVYRARDLRRGGSWAIKLMRTDSSLDPCAAARFTIEGSTASRLFHPNIVEVREGHLDSDGTPFLVMELLTGEDLLTLLERRSRLPLEQVLDIVGQVGSALQVAHALGIVHRDIKPSHIFLSQPSQASYRAGPDRPLVKILDFGMAKMRDPQPAQQSAQGVTVGTPQYMPPECTYEDGRSIDGSVDQWALAVMTYRMLSGRLPFDEVDAHKLIMKIRNAAPGPLKQHMPGLPEHVYEAIQRAMSKRPEDRFPTIADYIRTLHGIRVMADVTKPGKLQAIALASEPPQPSLPMVASVPIPAPNAPPRFSLSQRPSSRRQRPALLSAALLVGLAVLSSTVASLPASVVHSRGNKASQPDSVRRAVPTTLSNCGATAIRPDAVPPQAERPAADSSDSPKRPPGTRFPPLRLAGKATS